MPNFDVRITVREASRVITASRKLYFAGKKYELNWEGYEDQIREAEIDGSLDVLWLKNRFDVTGEIPEPPKPSNYVQPFSEAPTLTSRDLKKSDSAGRSEDDFEARLAQETEKIRKQLQDQITSQFGHLLSPSPAEVESKPEEVTEKSPEPEPKGEDQEDVAKSEDNSTEEKPTAPKKGNGKKGKSSKK